MCTDAASRSDAKGVHLHHTLPSHSTQRLASMCQPVCARRRATDRLAVSKLVSHLTRASVKSPLAQCLLVRYVSQVR